MASPVGLVAPAAHPGAAGTPDAAVGFARGTGSGAWAARALRSPLLLPSALLVVYLVVRPPVADLAAQVARADVAGSPGTGVWWTGWFGGVTLPTYSTISPWLMSALGAPLAGALAAAVSLVAAQRLLRCALRPRLGVAAFGVMDVADLFAGRVTFALGLALGLLCLLALARPRTVVSLTSAASLAILCCLASPLAGLFTGVATSAVLLAARGRRGAAALTSAALLATGGALALLFPDAGNMPTTVADVLPALAVAVGVGVVCRPPVVRVGAVLTVTATVVFTVAPGAVGANMTRLPWVLGAPLVVAYGHLPWWGRSLPRRLETLFLTVAAVTATLAPGLDLAHQLHAAADRSTSPAFYAPLLAELRVQRAATADAPGERVEVVDPRTHWSSVYVAADVPLARGWNRQADAALNPLFYQPGALTAETYLAWLHSMAVGWVALPHARLDYASAAEGRLVASGVPGLQQVWSARGWTLYRVVDPSPLVDGASVLASDAGGVTLEVTRPGVALVRLRWSPYLTVVPVDGGSAPVVCPEATLDGMTEVRLPVGRWRVTSDLARDAAAQFRGGCEDESSAAAQKPMTTSTADRTPSARRPR